LFLQSKNGKKKQTQNKQTQININKHKQHKTTTQTQTQTIINKLKDGFSDGIQQKKQEQH